MLGGSMDGLSSESNKFVVCAPNLKDMSQISVLRDWYFIHGICYWVSDTKNKKPTKVTQITNSRDSQSSAEMYYAQQGFSIHVTEKNEEFLIGVPGADSKFSIGTVFRYKSNGRIERVTIPNKIPAYSYFGYAVSSGYFSDSKSDLFYIASAPRDGKVAIFYDLWNTINFYLALIGSQMGEYYGYSLLVEDFNNDTLPDLVVGAPLFNYYFIHGICYWVSDTKNKKPKKVTQITHTRDGRSSAEMDLAQQGFSVHVTEKNEEFLIGVPGANSWTGTVFRYKSDGRIDRLTISYIIPEDSYFGYAVSSGYFSDSKSKLFYIVSAPRDERVAIFYESWNTIEFYDTLYGSQMGEYYGYSLLVEDFNNDTLPDLVVGAPLFSKNTFYEHGAVYVYMNQKKKIRNQLLSHISFKYSIGTVFRYKSKNRIDRVALPHKIPWYSYFGYAVSSGYFSDSKSDLFYIVSAPRDQKVDIFYESSNTINFYLALIGSQMGEYYGYSLLVEDFNNDTLPDLVVGAPLFSKNTLHEHGAVYVYMNQKKTITKQV
ncbi:unnamed protein product [Diamesa tonsa]